MTPIRSAGEREETLVYETEYFGKRPIAVIRRLSRRILLLFFCHFYFFSASFRSFNFLFSVRFYSARYLFLSFACVPLCVAFYFLSLRSFSHFISIHFDSIQLSHRTIFNFSPRFLLCILYCAVVFVVVIGLCPSLFRIHCRRIFECVYGVPKTVISVFTAII